MVRQKIVFRIAAEAPEGREAAQGIWCGRRDSNPHGVTPNGFSYQLRLSPPPSLGLQALAYKTWRLWSGLSLHPSDFALGAARLVSTPSRLRAWLGIAIAGFPDFEQFCTAGFPAGTQSFKSVASTVPPRPRTPIYTLDAPHAPRSPTVLFPRRLTARCHGRCDRLDLVE